jgi:methylase of polypeptide subunit release factors
MFTHGCDCLIMRRFAAPPRSVRTRTESGGAVWQAGAMNLANIDPDALYALGRALQAAGYRFTTVTPATHQRVNERPGNERARDLRDVFGWSRPFVPAALGPELRTLMERAGVLSTKDELLCSRVRASTLAGRLYFHSAFPSEAEDAVFFGPDTYRFAAALDRALAGLACQPARAIDIGTGAGTAAIHIARRFGQAEAIAADVNEQALALAAVNARLADAGNVRCCKSDLLGGVAGDFDLIVANPPYVIDPEGRTYRDGGGEQGLGISLALLDAAVARLRPGGSLLVYTGVAIANERDPFLKAASARLGGAGMRWTYEELDPDVFGGELARPQYANADRIAVVWLQAQRA